MRLIDADKLIKPGMTDMFDEPIVFTSVTKARVDAMPTIEAIPVEWIKKYLIKIQNWVDDYYAVKDMLETWEKENEIN